MADYTASTYTKAALPAWAEDPSKFSAEDLGKMAGPMQGATTYTPDDNALVAKNLQKLLSQNDPWMVSARARAAQYSNRRGLLNSSIAVGEGEKAAIDTAIPVATTDAQSWLQAQRDNAAAQNLFARDSNAFSREGALSALRAGYDWAKDDRRFSFDAGESAAKRALDADIAARDEALRREDLGLKREGLDADTRLRESDLALRDRTLATETELRNRELARLEKAGATDEELRRADLAMREKTLTTEVDLKNKDLALRTDDLALRRDSAARDAQGREAELLQQMQRSYLDARTRLESDPNLDKDAKARAIDGMNQWFEKTALPSLRASLGNPAAWPDFGTYSSTSASNPAPSGGMPESPTSGGGEDLVWADMGDGPVKVPRSVARYGGYGG